jgi:hypothetical protein
VTEHFGIGRVLEFGVIQQIFEVFMSESENLVWMQIFLLVLLLHLLN